MKKRLEILVLFDSAGPPPADQDFTEQFEKEDWFTEAAVVETLRNLGCRVRTFGIYDDISILVKEVLKLRPDVIFNLTEIFMEKAHLDKNVASFLEMLGIPYTGCGPDGLMICNNKALSKKILTFHRIKVPDFHVFYKGKRIWHPKRLKFPLFVKPVQEEASTGISQASFVDNEKTFCERIRFIHESLNMDALAEEYIDGRELYASVIGNKQLDVFPLREMKFTEVPEDEPKVATYKAKWDEKYRERWGIKNEFAGRLPNGTFEKISNICKKAYRMLQIDGYARFDLRLTEQGEVFILEANANPELAQGDEFAESAQRAGLAYDKLITKIVDLAFKREKGRF